MNTANQDLRIQKLRRSQRYFNKGTLFFYDLLLYGVISKYAWGCSIQRLDSHYKKYTRGKHLEVGVGTGFLLNRARDTKECLQTSFQLIEFEVVGSRLFSQSKRVDCVLLAS